MLFRIHFLKYGFLNFLIMKIFFRIIFKRMAFLQCGFFNEFSLYLILKITFSNNCTYMVFVQYAYEYDPLDDLE